MELDLKLDEIKTAGFITTKDDTIFWNNQDRAFESFQKVKLNKSLVKCCPLIYGRK